MPRKRAAVLAGGMILVWAAGAAAVSHDPPQAVADTMFASAKVGPKIPVAARPFPLASVRLLPGPFREAMDRDLRYLLSLDPDRFLHTFRLNAGLATASKPYGGWEVPDGELRGHSLGHYLSACAFMYASTGDARIKVKAEAVVAGLAECQKALGPRGYLSAFPEEHFDRVESLRRVWAPYYVIHKILAGLIDWAEHGKDPRALAIAGKMADWIKGRTDRSDDDHMQRVLEHTEQGGMVEALANLYSLTGDPEHLKLARRFEEKRDLRPLAALQDRLTGKHVNSFVPNIVGEGRLYEMTGESELRKIASYFWRQVTSARTFATGGTSNHERWQTDPHILAPELGTNNNETCCTYNLMKLSRQLFTWTADPSVADYTERALLNGILSTQDPADGMMMYHQAMQSGLYKTFMTPEDSFWCCTGSGMENHAKSGDSIYFHDADGLYVNLFIASELRWPEKGLTVRQETRFPEEEGTSLLFTSVKPVEASLRIRIPGWTAPGGSVAVNGRKLEAFAAPGSYLILRRTWRTGDKVEVVLPMSLRLERLPDDPKIAAILYGPTVLAGELGTEGLTPDKIVNQYAPTGDPVPVPRFETGNPDPSAWIKPVAGKPLTFRTNGVGNPADVTLVPYYRLFGQRYAIYWTIGPPAVSKRGENP